VPVGTDTIDYAALAIESALATTGVTDTLADSRFLHIDGSGVATVVIDTGIDLNHPFFGPDANSDGISDRILFQYDFADDDADASDMVNHGSHVASIIASQDDSYPGVAPGTDLISLKVFKDSGAGYFSYLEKALQWVIANRETYHIGVVNLSLGDGSNWTDAFSLYGIGDELSVLAGSDVIMVAAAGNNYYQYNSMGVAYPASDPAVLAVGATWAADFGGPWRIFTGATDYTTGADRITSFSQRDDDLLDTFAPGARFSGASATGGIKTMEGTSQAAAFVSGIAALSQQIAWETLGRGLTTGEFSLLLAETGDMIVDGDNEVDNVHNTGIEYGRINFAALAERILTLGADPAGGGDPSGGNSGSDGALQPAAPGVRTVDLAPGQHTTDLDFGNFKLGEISGMKFNDADGDGTRDTGESGLEGWTIYLDSNDNGGLDEGEVSIVTDEAGTYSFASLGPDTYRVREVTRIGWSQTTPESGYYGVVMTSGLLASGRDFGNRYITGNVAPVATDDGYDTDEDTPLTISASGVLVNDTDFESDPLTAVLVAGPAHGDLTLNPDGSFTYTPASDYNGSDSFTYKANDGVLNSNVATVSLTINPVNDAPSAVDDVYIIAEDTALATLHIQVTSYSVPYVTDWDGDGLFDLLVGEKADADGKVRVYINQGTGTAPLFDTFSYAQSNGSDLTVAAEGCLGAFPNTVDWNDDGHEDLLIAMADGTLRLYLNNGDGTGFDGGTVVQAGSSGAKTDIDVGDRATLDVFDWNDDGRFDLVLGALDGKVRVYLNQGAAGSPDFVDVLPVQERASDLVVPTANSSARSSVVMADLNGDGLADLLSGNTDGQLVFYANSGTAGAPVFTSHEYLTADGLPVDLAEMPRSRPTVFDFNGDDVADILVGSQDGTVRLYLGQAASVSGVLTFTGGTSSILGNDTDIDTDTLTAILDNGPSHGALTFNFNGSFSYTPELNYNGPDSFTYRAYDGTAYSNVATVAITVTPVNDAPLVVNDLYTTDEDTTLNVPATGVLFNDTDVESDPLTAVLVDNVAQGILTLDPDGFFSYTPDLNFFGTDSFTYNANDGSADSIIATVTITVNAINDPPVAAGDLFTTNEDTTLNVAASGVLTNDTDVEFDSLTAVLVDSTTHGALTLNPDGSFTYEPELHYNGTDSFTYKANDDLADSNVATVTLNVGAVNNAPVAMGDSYSTDEDTSLTIVTSGVLANDTDVESDPLTAVLVDDVTHGILTLNPDGSFSYTPDLNYNGTDSFTYKANDGLADSNAATVTITVNAINDSPVAAGDLFTTNEDTTLNVVAAPGLLFNDTDVESDPLTTVLVNDAAHGTLALNSDGSFTYNSSTNYFGPDSFTYQAYDGIDYSNVTTVSLFINPVNDAPVVTDDAYATNEDTQLVIAAPGILGNDTDIDSVTLSVSWVSDPSHGALTLNPDGSFTYMPSLNYNGPDNFTYKAYDGTDYSNIATVAVNVGSLNTPPVAFDNTYIMDEDTLLTVPAVGVLSNDTDVESDPLTVVLIDNPTHGTLVLNSDGSFTYMPSPNYNGPDSFTYQAYDGTDYSNTATVTLTINSINDAPVVDIAGTSRTVNEGSLVAFSGSITDVDNGFSELTYVWDFDDSTPLVATTLTPNHIFADNGVYNVSLTAVDLDGAKGTDTVVVTVRNVAPTVSASVTTQTVQYSDGLPSVVTFTAIDPSTADILNATVSYSYNGSKYIAGLPDAASLTGGLSFNGSSSQNTPATWGLDGIADMKPGTYVIQVGVADDDGSAGYASTTLVVNGEDAQAAYAGPSLVFTNSAKNNKAIVQLQAFIQDSGDAFAGNVSMATVSFVNRDKNSVIASNVPVSSSGLAVYNWQANLGGKDFDTFNIGIVVDGYYVRSTSTDNSLVTVARPLTNFITGGGSLINVNSAGIYGGDSTLETDFGFGVKLDQNVRNRQGDCTTIIRHAGNVYQVTTNSINSMTVNIAEGTATFAAQASMTNITDPRNPVVVSNNLQLVVTVSDFGTESGDKIGFTLTSGNTLLFSSNWTGAGTVEQSLNEGNIVVRGATLMAEDVKQTEYPVLTRSSLVPIAAEAVVRWNSSLGNAANNADLAKVQYRIADLDGATLGIAWRDVIWLDVTAAGNGWFIDSTPADDGEFLDGVAPQGMDLLTVVMHEMGHILGYTDTTDPGTVMTGTLETGVRITPEGTATSNNDSVAMVRHENPMSLVSMSANIVAENLAGKSLGKAERSWLVDFLKEADPNKDVVIKL
jgi:VCBS repeat-containing protein